jgi:hypothetical protein
MGANWLVRIETGEEVIRRDCNLPRNADDQTSRQSARHGNETVDARFAR